MVGKHAFSEMLRNISRSFPKTENLEKIIPQIRSQTRLAFPFQDKLVKPVDVNLISRRFLHQRNDNSGTGSSQVLQIGQSWKSKYLGAVGTIIGIGSSIALFEYMQNLSRGLYGAECADCTKGEGGDGKQDGGCIPLKCEDSPCLRKNDCEEELTRKANNELVKALKDVKGKALTYTEAAMKAYCEAIAIMKEYMDKSYCVMSDDALESPKYEEEWCRVWQLAKKRCAKVKEAIEKGQCAWELLCRLKAIIDEGKSCKYTACHPLLVTAEEFLVCAQREILNLKARMDCVGSDHEMVGQYRDVIKSFKNLLKAELDTTPDTERCCVQSIEQENALFINEAYIKAVRAHKPLAQKQILSGQIPPRAEEVEC